MRLRQRLGDRHERQLAILGPTLGQLRRERGLSLRDVEALTNQIVSGPALCRIERGQRQPGVRTLLALSYAYGLQIEIERGRLHVRLSEEQRAA